MHVPCMYYKSLQYYYSTVYVLHGKCTCIVQVLFMCMYMNSLILPFACNIKLNHIRYIVHVYEQFNLTMYVYICISLSRLFDSTTQKISS